MAFRALQLCLVFAIGLCTGPAPAVGVGGSVVAPLAGGGSTGTAAPAGGEIPLSLSVRDPQDVTVARGQPATLRCALGNSTGPLSVTWRHDGHDLLRNDSRRQVQGDGSLFIRRVAGKRIVSVEGAYSCLVQNTHGSIITNSAKLRVAMLAKEFLKQPQDTWVEVNQPILLSCLIQSVPAAQIAWERDKKTLPHNTRYVFLPSGDLVISMTTKTDAGSYRCKATNEISQKHRYSEEATVGVLPVSPAKRPPKFLVLSNELNLTVLVGNDLPLNCIAIGNPRPNIRWTFSSNVSLGNSSTLWLRNISSEQTGVYSCNAHNSEGQVNQFFNVMVVQAPFFLKTPVSQWFPSARTVRLECRAEGIPTPQIRWLKNGAPLSIGGRIKMMPASMLLLSHTFSTDSGLYQCIAENQFGKIWSAVQLVANGSLISPPMNVRCNSFNTTSICLRWDTPPGVNITAFSVHMFNADMSTELITQNTYFLAQKLKPITNYTFYIRVYSMRSTSNQSENITCQTVLLGSRNIKLKPLTNSSVRVDWTTLSSDTPCGGIAEYKLQWRKFGHPSNNVKLVFSNHYTITGLSPSQKYEVRVKTPNNEDEELSWTDFIMPNNYDNTEVIATSESPKTVMAPINLEAEPLSPFNINLTWKDPRKPKDVLEGGYYMICYTEVRSQQKCENGHFIKSTSTSIEIANLTPYTIYEFKVRAHNLDGSYGQFSHSVECRTLEYVPNPITNLMWKMENVSSVCLRWRKPNIINGQLLNYVISYSYLNQSLDQWPSIILPVSQAMSQWCWRASVDTVSTHLTSLEPGRKYRVVVRAATSAGLSPPSDALITVRTTNWTLPATAPPPHSDELHRNQKLGIIVGVSIALLCVVACISCMVFRRRCLKARALERARMYAPRATNGQSVAGAQPAVVDSIMVSRLPVVVAERQQCDAEAHELQYLVAAGDSAGNTHIPPLAQSHLDTKGGVTYPNGQTNGLKFVTNGHIPNGHVHITENPQFDSFTCNGHYNGSSESHQLLTPDPSQNQDDSLLDDTFNSTQLTNLEESLPISAVRTLSPVLGPNG